MAEARRVSPTRSDEGVVPGVSETYEVPAVEFRRLNERAEDDALGGAHGLIRRGGAVLLVRTVESPTEWLIPGDDRKPGENYSMTAKRSVEETTGLTVSIEKPLARSTVTFRHATATDRTVSAPWLWFGATDSGGDVATNDQAVLAAGWFTELPASLDEHVASAARSWIADSRD